MTAHASDSRIINSFLPSLSHLAKVKVALQFFNDFDIQTLNAAFKDIELGNSSASNESGKGHTKVNYNRAKAYLLLIPGLLRKSVLEAIHGMHYEAKQWRLDHLLIEIKRSSFYWRSEGTIDAIKTAQQLVLDQNINIRKRFEVACMYCLEKNIRTLWGEIKASGGKKCFNTVDNIIVHFWVGWLRERIPVPWYRAVLGYLYHLPLNSRTPLIRFSTLYPLLHPKERKRIFRFEIATDDDFRFSLYAVNKEEEKKILQRNAKRFLLLHLKWPLQTLFLETAQRMRTFIDIDTFLCLINFILSYHELRRDFDYGEIFENFWNSSPNNFRERALVWSSLKTKIDSCLNDMKSERKAKEVGIKPKL